jgi:hypothetical protein
MDSEKRIIGIKIERERERERESFAYLGRK